MHYDAWVSIAETHTPGDVNSALSQTHMRAAALAHEHKSEL